MKLPMSLMSLAIAAATILAVMLSARAVEDATVVATCKAAAANDVQVNQQLCLSRLGNTTASNTWGLAKVATDACISSSILYQKDLVAITVELEAGNRELKPMVDALAECGVVNSGDARMAFDEAKKEIKEHSYAAAMKQLDEGMSSTQKCIAGLTAVQGVKIPEPLGQHLGENIQLAIIAKAITSLIK